MLTNADHYRLLLHYTRKLLKDIPDPADRAHFMDELHADVCAAIVHPQEWRKPDAAQARGEGA